RQCVEQGAQAVPGVVMTVVGCALGAALPHPANRISIPIRLAGKFGRDRRAQEIAVFGGVEEDQAINETQKVFIVGLSGEVARLQSFTQSGVCGIFQEATAKFEKRSLYA